MSVAGRCPVCETPLPEAPAIRGGDLLHGVAGEFSVHLCAGCGAGVTRPEAAEGDLGAYYPDSYGPHASHRRHGGTLGRALLRREIRVGAVGTVRELPPGRLLDVGCGGGDLGALLIERCWIVDGIEPSAEACARARERGLNAQQGTLETVELSEGAYDAVLFSHSLEHIGDPVGALRIAGRALRPGGVALVSVPNFDCWARRRFGREWFHLDLPRHRVHFTEGSLRTAIKRAGLDPRRTWATTSSTGIGGSLQYRRMGGLAVGEGPAREKLGQAAGMALVPVARAEQALGGGRDFLHAVASRPRVAG